MALTLLAPVAARGQTEAAASDTARPRLPSAERVRASGPLLDVPISRSEYRLGAGDEVDIAIFGDINDVFSVPVSPEGSVLVPGIGIVPVLGLNLDQAEARVRGAVGRLYRDVEVRVALSRVRTFKVYVVGDVPNPGMRTANAATRVSEVLEEQTAPGRSGEEPARRRNVTLRRASGEIVAVDLVRFRQSGDFSANPVLREGDALLVPSVDARVSLFGSVRFPGVYEYRPGESLAELLDIANGTIGFPTTAADTVRLVRFRGQGEPTTVLFTRDEATGAVGRSLRLEPFDGIYIAELGGFTQRAVTVHGEVRRPGAYPITTDSTSVRDLLRMAGGLTPWGSLAGATLRRHVPPARSREIAAIPPELLTAEERKILQIQSQADASFVVVDFRNLLAAGGDAADQVLRAGDELIIPVRRNEVTVLGAVRTPGIVGLIVDGNIDSYVQAAGGYGRRAARGDIVVLRGPAGTRTHWSDAGELQPGDTIVVPFRESPSWSAILRDTNAIVGTVLGLILAAATVL